LQAILTSGRLLLGMLIAVDRTRLQMEPEVVAGRIRAYMRWLKEIGRAEQKLDKAVEMSAACMENEVRLRSVPGVGPVSKRTPLTEPPGLGALPRRRLSTLVGIAPFNRDSGAFRRECEV
jgi:transposase